MMARRSRSGERDASRTNMSSIHQKGRSHQMDWLYATFKNNLLSSITCQVRLQLWKLRNNIVMKNQTPCSPEVACKLSMTEAANFLTTLINRQRLRTEAHDGPPIANSKVPGLG